MDTALIVTTAATIALAFLGYLITYLNNLRLSQRTEQLVRVNKQLSEFYGPLYALVSAGAIVWEAFRARYRPGIGLYLEY